MKTLLSFLLLFSSAVVFSQSDSLDTAPIELLRISPEPFDDYLLFEFELHDESTHEVKIMIRNSLNELVFMEKVHVSPGNTSITVNTVNFYQTGLYGIKVKMDHRYKVFRKFKHVH